MLAEQLKIWLSAPYMHGSEIKYIQEAFNSNWIAPAGSNIDGFELDLENYYNDNGNNSDSAAQYNAAALSSGTAAIHLGLVLLGVQNGDEVLVQTHTHIASANPVLYLGATPVFIDSEKDTWNICPLILEEAILDRIAKGKKPKAIVAVHLYGMPYKHDEINALSKKYGIPVLEESAEALGSSYKGQKCGTLGTIGTLSFNGNKIITTSGGGAIVTNKKEWKEKAIFLSTQAKDKAAHYQHSEIGYNYRLSNICAGIGRGQMEVLNSHVALRRAINAFYTDLFSNIEGVSVFKEYNAACFSNHWLTAVLIDADSIGSKTSENLRLALLKNEIESRPLWKPMHLQPVFKDCLFYGGNVAKELFGKGLCLPSGSNLTEIDKQRIHDSLHRFFN